MDLLEGIDILEQHDNWQKYLAFAKESNAIEGICSETSGIAHATTLSTFVEYPKITLKRLENFVSNVEPKAFLRTEKEHTVIISGQLAPPPTESIPKLVQLLQLINRNEIHPFIAHVQYEYLHPFMDGNGRSGRALWLWQMVHYHNWSFSLPFLHKFYYQMLSFKAKQISFFEKGVMNG